MRLPWQRRLFGYGWLVLAVAVMLLGGFRAEASTVAGRISGAPIPAAGAGQAFVRAVNLQTGEIATVDDTDATGRYRVTVPRGAFALFPTVVTLRKVFSPKPTRVRLRRGQRRSVSLRAQQATTIVRPIVALPDESFRGGTGEFAVLNKGLRDMLITDLIDVKTATCDLSLVERSMKFTDAYNLELALVRRGLVDPTTAIRPGRLISPTRGVRGTITVANGRMRIDAETYKWSSKKTLRGTSVEGPAEAFFELEADLARRLTALLCEQPVPIKGTFTGSLDYAKVTPVGAIIGTLDWDGALELVPSKSLGGLPPQFGGPTTLYEVQTGSFTAHIRIVPAGGGCTISGQGTFDVNAVYAGMPPPALSVTDGDPDTYRLALDGNLAQIPTVLSACPPGQETSNGRTGVWPLLGIGLLPFTQNPSVTTSDVFAGSATGSMPGTDDGYTWTWSLRG